MLLAGTPTTAKKVIQTIAHSLLSVLFLPLSRIRVLKLKSFLTLHLFSCTPASVATVLYLIPYLFPFFSPYKWSLAHYTYFARQTAFFYCFVVMLHLRFCLTHLRRVPFFKWLAASGYWSLNVLHTDFTPETFCPFAKLSNENANLNQGVLHLLQSADNFSLPVRKFL